MPKNKNIENCRDDMEPPAVVSQIMVAAVPFLLGEGIGAVAKKALKVVVGMIALATFAS